MNQISSEHERLRNVLIAKLGLPKDRFQRDNLIAEAVQGIIHDRDNLTKLSADLRTQRDALYSRLTQVVDVKGEPTLEELVERLVTGRDKAVTTLKLAGYTDNGAELWKPPLGETPERFKPRYIVHGDIQPCTVLYSDETTTLVRLDENDMMCETSTIEWSDELTYRCQEMLSQVGAGSARLTAAKWVAELVANEELLINDNGADPAYFRDENIPSVYRHTSKMFGEEAMRMHGWTTEQLVNHGYGEYR